MSPDKNFRWEKILPFFKPVLRPLTFQLSKVKPPPRGGLGKLLATIQKHYLYFGYCGMLTIITKILALLYNKRAGKKRTTTKTYSLEPSPHPLPQMKLDVYPHKH